MRKYFLPLFFCLFIAQFSKAQYVMSDSLRKVKDSTLKALFTADSLKVENEFKEKTKWEKFKSLAQYPVINGGLFSGVIPVKDPTEIPDPTMDYKLLFELSNDIPDSLIDQPNEGLVEVARLINLHVASGIPLKKIFPVVVIHGSPLVAICTNNYYQKKFKTDNPNLKLIADLEKAGVKFIACGQAMAFKNITKDDLLPEVKVSFTAQTVLTSYQLKGYVWMAK